MAGFDVDTQPYATLGGGREGNPLGMLAAGVSIQRGMNENALFQQTFAARKAMGPLAQASIDPETGQMDYNKFAMLISSHPETAWMAPDVINKMVERQLTQAHIVQTHLETEAKKRDVINGAIGSLVTKGDDAGPTDLMHALASPEVSEFISPQQQAALVISAPKKGPALTQWIQQHAVQNAEAAKALEYVKGQYHETVDNNGNKQGGYASPLTSTFTPATMAGPAGAAPAPSAGFPAPGSPDTIGGPASTSAAPAARQPMITGLSPMREEMLKDVPEYGKRVNANAQNARTLMLQMKQVEDYLPHFKQGGGQEFRGRLSQLAQAAGLDNQFIDTYINQGSLANKQAAQKMFFNAAAMIGGQLIHNSGGRYTQSEWSQWLQRGSPNIDMTPEATRGIMRGIRELSDYTTLEQKHYYDYTANPRLDPARVQQSWGTLYDKLLADRTKK